MRSEYLLLIVTAGLCCAQRQQDPSALPVVRESVIVTGTYEPLTIEESDRSVVVLPIRNWLPLLNGISDVLKLDPSLDLRERAPGGVQADLSIRGSGFGQTLVLLNGIRLNDAQSGHHDMDIPVPLEGVARIETLRGSGSTMYGSDAVGGAINIVTEPPKSAEFRLRTAVGNFGTNQQRGSIGGVAGRVSGRLAFSRDFSSGFMPDRDYRNLQLAATATVATGLGAADATFGYMDHPFGADQFYGNFNSWENTKTWFAAWRQTLGEKTTASVAYRRHSDLFVLYRDRPAYFTNHHADNSWQAAIRRREPLAPSITVYYGAEALRESMESSNLGRHRRSRAAAYGALSFRALRRFSLSLAAREEAYRRFSGEFSPTVAGGVWLSPHFKLRASASRSFRMPSYTDLYYHDPGNVGSPDLRPERAWSYEAGLDWNAGPRVRGGVTVFTRRERDGIDYYRSAPGEIWRALNIQNLNFTGAEASLSLAPARGQNVDLRYTVLRARQDTVPAGLTKYSFQYPKHSGAAAWQGTLFGSIMARTRLGAMERFGSSPYAIWDIAAAAARGRVRPFLQLANITSVSYEEVQGVRMPGRTVLGGVEVLLRGN